MTPDTLTISIAVHQTAINNARSIAAGIAKARESPLLNGAPMSVYNDLTELWREANRHAGYLAASLPDECRATVAVTTYELSKADAEELLMRGNFPPDERVKRRVG